MKHTVFGFSQRRALALESDRNTTSERKTLSHIDLFVLRIFTDMLPSFTERRIFEDSIFVRIDFERIRQIYPVIQMSEQQFMVAVAHLCSFKVLEMRKFKDDSTLYVYYGYGKNYDFLINDDREFIESVLPVTFPMARKSNARDTFEKYAFNVDEFVRWWNDKTDFTKIKYMTDVRMKALAKRLQECKDREEFYFIMQRAANSAFLSGKGKVEFVADIDFVLKKVKFVKISEGFYDNKPSIKRRNNFSKYIPTNEKDENLIDWE